MLAPTAARPGADPDFPAFQAACRSLGLELTQPQYDSLVRYTQLLRDWNTRLNLVSRRDTDRILTYHVVDSLAVQRLIPQSARVCDIGTGAGLPGIPIALVRADVKMYLIESSQKKSRFLQTATAELGLGTVEVLNERAESLPGLDCDVILSRLAGPLRDVVQYARPHRKPKGTIVLYKTRDPAEELRKAGRVLARHKLRVTGSYDILLPLSRVPRRFVVLGS
ncbi:MAG: 16S rRNA (guanine(527)-N(7))-methyltransferase RsmG [candidate division WOR-3 bacterium]|nr:16S rRNA (guanine(527)-N(7))-methyltransferase RsmG [candidate division WOR-3 bacterium]